MLKKENTNMVKCANCDYTNEIVNVPMICPKCGHIAKPFVKKMKKTKENATVIETVELKKLES